MDIAAKITATSIMIFFAIAGFTSILASEFFRTKNNKFAGWAVFCGLCSVLVALFAIASLFHK